MRRDPFEDLEIVDDRGRFRVPDPELLALARRICSVFVDVRPEYTPGKVTIPKKAYNKFYQAAELCKKQGLSPERFVRQQLEGMARTGNFWPAAIANSSYVPDAQALRLVDMRTIYHYKSQLICYARWSKIHGQRETLCDDTLQLTPLFRAVTAGMLGFEDILAKYREEALQELEARPLAREIFAEGLEHLNVHIGAHRHPTRADDTFTGHH